MTDLNVDLAYDRALLSKAVYDLDKIQINASNGFDNLANATELFGGPKFSAQEIAYLNANYTCVSMNNGNSSGFEGAVFVNNNTNEAVISFAGTDILNVNDILNDSDIAMDGHLKLGYALARTPIYKGGRTHFLSA